MSQCLNYALLSQLVSFTDKKSISVCVWEKGEGAGASVCFQKSDKDDEIRGLEVIL